MFLTKIAQMRHEGNKKRSPQKCPGIHDREFLDILHALKRPKTRCVLYSQSTKYSLGNFVPPFDLFNRFSFQNLLLLF